MEPTADGLVEITSDVQSGPMVDEAIARSAKTDTRMGTMWRPTAFVALDGEDFDLPPDAAKPYRPCGSAISRCGCRATAPV